MFTARGGLPGVTFFTEPTIDETDNPRKAAALALAEPPAGFKDATRDPERIAGWFDVKPRCNIGIACGVEYSLVVADVDVKNGAHGMETLRELGIDALTLTVNTPSGGLHLYLKHPVSSTGWRSAQRGRCDHEQQRHHAGKADGACQRARRCPLGRVRLRQGA